MGERKPKKKKRSRSSGGGEDEEGKFKWQEVIDEILQREDGFALPITKVQKRVRAMYRYQMGQGDMLMTNKQILKKFLGIVNNSKRYKVENSYITHRMII